MIWKYQGMLCFFSSHHAVLHFDILYFYILCVYFLVIAVRVSKVPQEQ